MSDEKRLSDAQFKKQLLKKIDALDRFLNDRLWAIEEWGPTDPQLQEAHAELMNLKEVFNEHKEAFHVRYTATYDTTKRKQQKKDYA